MTKTEDRQFDLDDTPKEGSGLRNHVLFIVDKSGSMQRLRSDVVEFVNAQIAKARESSVDMETHVSLVTFSSMTDPAVFWDRDITSVEPMTIQQYVPVGGTALNDAIGNSLKWLKNVDGYEDERLSFLILIVTDGEENASTSFTAAAIASMIAEMKKTDRFTFGYLGANQDLGKVSVGTGITAANMKSFEPTSRGLMAARIQTNSAMEGFYGARSRGIRSVKSFYEVSDPKSGTKK